MEANILVEITLDIGEESGPQTHTVKFNDFPLFSLPLMLHSRYCLLHNKSASFLKEAGECPQD